MSNPNAGPAADQKLPGPVFLCALAAKFMAPALTNMAKIDRRQRIGDGNQQPFTLGHSP